MLGACGGLGIGRTGAAYQPMVAFTERAQIVEAETDKSGRATGWGRVVGEAAVGWGDFTKGLFGVHASYLLGHASSSQEGLPGSGGFTYPWHLTGVLGLGPFCLIAEYQRRVEEFDYKGGFAGELYARVAAAYIGFAPVPFAGVSVGGGRVFDGELRMGVDGERTRYGVASATGYYAGVNFDAFLLGGGFLQYGFRPRLSIGYTHASSGDVANVPSSYSSFSATAEMVFTVF